MTFDLVAEDKATLEPPPRAREAPTQAAAAVFAVALFLGFVFYVLEARNVWFFRDDWEFLAARGFNWHDLMRQHGGHWVALPLATYRFLYFVVGLRSYLPYQLLTIGLHLAAALLLRLIMRRAGVSPWVATVTAGLFIFLGSASQDILWGFQIAFSGALVLGLVQLLLVDHDGTIDRRDWIGLVAGFAAIMCSGVGVTMVGIVGLSALVRRGWPSAAFHVLPVGAVYGAWYLHYDRTGAPTVTSISELWDWSRTGMTGAFDALVEVPFVGWILGVMLVLGLTLAWRHITAAEFRRRFAVPCAMLVGAAAFLVISGANRAWAGIQFAASSRYLHIVSALLLPSIAVAAEAVIRRWRTSAVLVFALLLIGIPGNIRATGTNFLPRKYFADSEQTMRSLPRMALARQVPRDVRPELANAPWANVGWLLDAARSGRLPAPRNPTEREFATNTLRLSLDQLNGGVPTTCKSVQEPLFLNLNVGESVVVRGTIVVQLVGDEPGNSSLPVVYGDTFLAGGGIHTLKNVGESMTLRIFRNSPLAAVCGLPVHLGS